MPGGLDALASYQGALAGALNPIASPQSSRGIILQLGKVSALNLNAVAATTIFTTPASGINRCVLIEIVADNFSGTPTTNAISFGASATPTDWLAAVVLAASGGVGKGLSLYPATNVGYAVYGPGIAIVANVTIGGAAITADFTVLGYYE
jgi:hypothetical protein